MNERKLAVLKSWYAIFTTIMDTPETPAVKMGRLIKLRELLAADEPELEAIIQRETRTQ